MLTKAFQLAIPTSQAPWPPKVQHPLDPRFKCNAVRRVTGSVWSLINHPNNVLGTIKNVPMSIEAQEHQTRMALKPTSLILPRMSEGAWAPLVWPLPSSTRSLWKTSSIRAIYLSTSLHWGHFLSPDGVLVTFTFLFPYCQVRVTVLLSSPNPTKYVTQAQYPLSLHSFRWLKPLISDL